MPGYSEQKPSEQERWICVELDNSLERVCEQPRASLAERLGVSLVAEREKDERYDPRMMEQPFSNKFRVTLDAVQGLVQGR